MSATQQAIRMAVAAAAITLASACATGPAKLRLLTIAKPAFGGEASFRGTLLAKHGCVITHQASGDTSVLFDPGVTLTENRDGLRDPRTGKTIHFRRLVRGGAATLRSGGKGWPIADIEHFFGVSISAGCPTRNVMRLHDLEELES
jgi:hypothetical protein